MQNKNVLAKSKRIASDLILWLFILFISASCDSEHRSWDFALSIKTLLVLASSKAQPVHKARGENLTSGINKNHAISPDDPKYFMCINWNQDWKNQRCSPDQNLKAGTQPHIRNSKEFTSLGSPQHPRSEFPIPTVRHEEERIMRISSVAMHTRDVYPFPHQNCKHGSRL